LKLSEMAEFKFIGYIAEIMGKRSLSIAMENPTKLENLLRFEGKKDRFVLLINKEIGNFDSVINNEDEVTIMSIISGG